MPTETLWFAALDLYSPYSPGADLGLPSAPFVYWFRPDRDPPLGFYGQLILDYWALTDAEQTAARRVLDELLTREEMEGLAAYLALTRGSVLQPGRVALPLDPRSGPRQVFGSPVPLSESAGTRRGACYRLSDEPQYDLPFPVCGYVVGGGGV